MLSGREPVRELASKSKEVRAVSAPILPGREPVRELASKCKKVRAVREPMHSGMVPVNPLVPRDIADKFPKLQRGSGREPVMLLS